MKKRLTFITLLMLFCSAMFGQKHFEFTQEHLYSQTMTVNCIVSINGKPQTEGVEIAAFFNNVMRSEGATLKLHSAGHYYAQVVVHGNNNNEAITFKLYDGVKELNTDVVYSFKSNHSYGTPKNPNSIDFYETYWNYTGSSDVYMGVFASILINDELQSRQDLEVAAFSGDELRAVARPYPNTINGEQVYVASLNIAGNSSPEDLEDTETITFKLYDFKTDKILWSTNTLPFVDQTMHGADEPYKLFFYPYEVRVGETEYPTLAAAVGAAEEGATITVLKDLAEGCVIDKEVTINFAGFGLAEGKVISIKQDGVATFENDAKVTGVELYGGQLFTETALNIVAKKDFASVSANANTNVGWGTIATPIDGAEVPTFEGVQHDMYTYSESAMLWKYVGAIETFTLGMGYLYANSSAQDNLTIELEGILNVNNKDVALSYTENALAGFNMIGNPFSFNITEANFSGANLSNGFYVISAEGAIVARPENAIIAPMESVMVQTNAAATLTINKTAATKRNAADNGIIAINVSNANYSDVAYVSFNEGLGLNKINHRNTEIPMVYIPVEAENFAVATMSQDVTEIPVSFKAATMGEYTISVEAQECEYSSMTLVDRLTGVETNLLIEDYSFIAKTNDNAERFLIRLDNSQQSTDNGHFVYINNGMINFDVEGQAVVNVYDVTGRSVAEYNVTESASISTSEFTSGMYIIRMSDENGVKVQKIVVE